MRIIRETRGVSLDEFADQHGLNLKVTRCGLDRTYQVRFDPAPEVKRGQILTGAYGRGPSEASAIHDYASRISGELLVWDAWGTTRREVQAPPLFWRVEDDDDAP